MPEQTQTVPIVTPGAILKKLSEVDSQMSLTNALVFIVVASSPEQLTSAELSRELELKPGATTRAIFYWSVTRNFLMVGIDSTDRRRRTLALTEKGRAFLQTIGTLS